MTKSKLARILLWSLLPAFLLAGFITAELAAPPGSTNSWDSVLAIFIIYMLCALPIGIYLYLKGKKEDSTDAAQQYAERHGWHPITHHSWRNRKREGAALAVNRAHKGSTYILSIEYQGETTTVEEFEQALWALQFGDWLWVELRESAQDVSAEVLHGKREEWEDTQALAVRRNN